MLVLLLGACVGAGVVAAQPLQQGEPVRQSIELMHIGNSFSMDATRYLPYLARHGGKELMIYGAQLGGATLEQHAKNLKAAQEGLAEGNAYNVWQSLGLPREQKKTSLLEALAAHEWDFVTIQQRSLLSYRPESYEPYASELIESIRENAPQATILIHQTWAYRPDHPLFSRGIFDANEMHRLITAAYKELGERHGLGILPAGNAVHRASQLPQWQHRRDPNFNYDSPAEEVNPEEGGLYEPYKWRTNSRTGGKPGFYLDGFHLNTAGDYLAACVWYEILYNDSVLKVNYKPRELTQEQAAQLRQIAHDVVADYHSNGL